MESMSQHNWDELMKSLVEREALGEDYLELEGKRIGNAVLIANPQFLPSVLPNTDLKEEIDSYKKNLPNLQEKYQNAKIFVLKIPNFRKEPTSFLLKQIMAIPVVDESGVEKTFGEDCLDEELYYDKYVSIDGEMSKEDYLVKLDYVKPKKRSQEEIDRIFEKIYFGISSDSKEIQPKLAIGLSEQSQANEVLNKLIHEITGESIY